MQLSLSRGQFAQLCKMAVNGKKLINDEVLALCEVRERKGDYKDAQGNDVFRVTVILPTYETVNMKAGDYLKSIAGKVTEDPKEAPEEATAEGTV